MESLKSILSAQANQKIEFSSKMDDLSELAKTMVGFANSGGGRILLGVKSNGKIKGINPEEAKECIEEVNERYCKPSIKYGAHVHQEGMRLVYEVLIKADPEHRSKALDQSGEWKAYIRNGIYTVEANKIILKCWNFERKELPILSEYSTDELQVIRLAKGVNGITLSQLYKQLEIPPKRIDYIVSMILYSGVIEMEVTPDQTIYKTLQ